MARFGRKSLKIYARYTTAQYTDILIARFHGRAGIAGRYAEAMADRATDADVAAFWERVVGNLAHRMTENNPVK